MNEEISKFKKLLSSIGQLHNIFNAYKDSATPEGIKQGVIVLFSPYFNNKNILERVAVNELIPNAVEYTKLSQDKLFLELIRFSVDTHNRAKSINNDESIKICAEWMAAIFDGLSVFWSQFNLEQDKSFLGLEEFTFECLRNIGGAIEGCFKPIAGELLHQAKISIGETPKKEDIRALDLGMLVEELQKVSPNPDFFEIKDVRLNQWRNIAQHFSFVLDGNVVVCTYGRPGKQKEVRLTKEELFEVTKKAIDVFSCLRLANQLFFFDNIESINAFKLSLPHSKVRQEAIVLNLVSAIASQGFEVIEFIREPEQTKLSLKDVTNESSEVRKFYAVQLCDVLWFYFPADLITVDYYNRDGVPIFRSEVTKDIFERIDRENLERTIVAEEADLTDLRMGQFLPGKSKQQGGRNIF